MAEKSRDFDRPLTGTTVTLIRWRETRDGWAHDYHTGIYVKHDPVSWVLRSEYAVEHLDRQEWSRYTL